MSARVAILASGEGTTAEAFILACTAGRVDAEVVLVICNKRSAGIFKRIERLNQELTLSIQVVYISGKTHPAAPGEVSPPGGQTVAEQAAILGLFEKERIDLVLLMGYLRRIGPELIKAYGWLPSYSSPYQARMLNTHCGPLPETKGFWGIHIQEHILRAGLPSGGQTLHTVAENYDEGPIVAEHRIPVDPGETADSLFARAQKIEKQFLPEDIQAFLQAQAAYRSQSGAA